MTPPDFYWQTHAKWLLAGEHAVLRGYPALVFPLPDKFIAWHYWRTDIPLQVHLPATHNESLLVLFWNVLEEALRLANQKQQAATGQLTLDNSIPMGAGMGFSAAFCVGLTRWLIWQGWLAEKELFSFARQLENFFHGQSSGVDIAGSIANEGVEFTMPDQQQPLQLCWRPRLYLSYSGQASVTTKCVQQVRELIESDATRGAAIDQQMAHSVALAREALQQPEATGFALLAEALQMGAACFAQWQLYNPAMQQHEQQLRAAGACAVKPTGAGDGGYMLSLWNKLPQWSGEMIAVF